MDAMPHIDWSIDVGGIIMAVIALIFIPITKMLVQALWAMRETLNDLGTVVFGTRKDDSTGLVVRVKELEHGHKGHRNRLIDLEAEAGLKIQDRT